MHPAASDIFNSAQRFRPGMNVFVNRAYEAFKLPQHTHDAIEISYVIEGAGYQFINEATVPIKQGDIFVLPVGTSHVYRPSSPDKVGTLSVINCVFRLEALQDWGNVVQEESPLYLTLYAPQQLKKPWLHYYDQEKRFIELFYQLLSEYRQSQHGYEVVIQALFTQLMIQLHRRLCSPHQAGNRHPKIQDAIHFIKLHYTEDITLKQVARHSFLSVSHLQRVFKQATGFSFTSYVQYLRVSRCCELLKSTSMTVQQIAENVGYRDMKFFYALFRQKTGVTPQEYRKQLNA